MDQQPTVQMPATPEPTEPPLPQSPESSKKRTTLVAVIVVALVLLLAFAGSLWLLRRTGDLEQKAEESKERIAELERQLADDEADADEDADETADAEDVDDADDAVDGGDDDEPATYPEDGRHIGFITDISPLEDLTTRLEIDYVQFLVGDEANAAAAVHGDEVPVPNDYYVVNDNPMLRTFIVDPAAQVTLEAIRNPDESMTMGDFEMSVPDFLDDHWFVDVDWYDSWLYWIEVEQGEIVDIHQQFTP